MDLELSFDDLATIVLKAPILQWANRNMVVTL